MANFRYGSCENSHAETALRESTSQIALYSTIVIVRGVRRPPKGRCRGVFTHPRSRVCENAAFFFGDTAGVFDRLRFPSMAEAEIALLRNGFKRYDTDEKAKEFISKPEPPFLEGAHPNGPIYSSGRFWK